MKLLVTGANGLVGSAIRRQDPGGAVYATRADGDLRDFAQAKALLERHRPTHIIHAAAHVGGIGGNSAHPGEYFRDNLFINANVLEAARIVGAPKVLTFLSTCIFPDKCTYPLSEESLHDGPPHHSNFGYAYAKRMIDVQGRAYRKEWGCNFICAVGTNIYGPNDNFSLENSHVLPALIHKCYLAKQKGEDLNVWGSGNPLREFVHSDDVAKLALWAIEHYDEETPITFTSGIETSIREIAELVAKHMGFKGRLVFDASKPDGQLRKPSDATRLKRFVPDFAFTPVAEGVAKTVAWFQASYPNVRA